MRTADPADNGVGRVTSNPRRGHSTHASHAKRYRPAPHPEGPTVLIIWQTLGIAWVIVALWAAATVCGLL